MQHRRIRNVSLYFLQYCTVLGCCRKASCEQLPSTGLLVVNGYVYAPYSVPLARGHPLKDHLSWVPVVVSQMRLTCLQIFLWEKHSALTYAHMYVYICTYMYVLNFFTAASLKEIQAKLQAASEKSGGQESRLDQEENVSISGSSARLMIMKKLSRKSEV